MGTGHGQGQEATTATISAGPAQHLPEQVGAGCYKLRLSCPVGFCLICLVVNKKCQQNLPTKIV